ncbi:MAG: hypothetical protein J6J17_04575 [Bacilli bacterium]|nr:hypothetical protein [Bacilli bacterium]
MNIIINDKIVSESINKNQNISEADKSILAPCINSITNFFIKLGIAIPTENSGLILKKLNIVNDYNKDTNEFVSYNKERNELSFFWSNVNKDSLGDFYYHCIYSLLSILSMRYSEKYGQFVNGVEYINEIGITKGKMLNELLKRNITINISMENPYDMDIKNFYYDSPDYCTMYDNLLENILYSKIGLEKTLECFVGGQGDIIYSQFSNMIGEKDTQRLYDVIDSYPSNKIKNREIYDELLALLNISYEKRFNMNLM